MATSVIKKPEIKLITGTLTDTTTEDYVILDVIPYGYKVMSGRYLTPYTQWRPLQVGQGGTNLIIQNPVSNMANRPYEVFLYSV